MKSIYIIVTLFVGFFGKAQQPELINSTWNLEKVIINDIEHYFPNSITTINATTNFTLYSFTSSICNSFEADVTYNNNQITFSQAGLTLGSCPNSNNNEYNIFENYYFNQFFTNYTANQTYSIYNYQIENIDNNLKLTLTNPGGDHAIYWSGNLSIKDSTSNIFKIYPNPVKDKFVINTNDKIELVEIYSQSSQLIKTAKTNEIDISDLPKGIYIVKVKTDKDKISQKMIKE